MDVHPTKNGTYRYWSIAKSFKQANGHWKNESSGERGDFPWGILHQRHEDMTSRADIVVISVLAWVWKVAQFKSSIPCQSPNTIINLGKLEYFTNLNSSAIWGRFPILTMISSEGEQWGRYNLPRIINEGFINVNLAMLVIQMKW